ncbi:MAG TPA: hypothetical protein DC042_15025 [Bacteroidales bacterium]|nr:hypothetical protein [Bacteroidales bacterium]
MNSCTTLSLTEIRNLKHTEFEPLRLDPAIETNNLRIDLLRQTEEERVNDSTVTTEDTPYHPLGFDLGNGLFYDLNDNLSFRIDELLGITNEDCWSVERLDGRRQRRADCVWTLCGDTLTLNYPSGRRERYIHHGVHDGATTLVKSRNRLLYAVDFNGGQTVYRYRTRKLDVIEKAGENEYSVRGGFRREYFRLQGNRLLLNRGYSIELSDRNQKIRIIQSGWLGSRVMLTMEKSGNFLYLYDRNYHGQKLESGDGCVTVFRDGRLQTRWRRIR